MSFLSEIHTKLRALFSAKMVNAAQAWRLGKGVAVHAYWMYAAPVNMVLGRDSFFLSEPAPLAMSNDESDALIASLNQHFSEAGHHFYKEDDVWFLGLDKDPQITTTDINQVKNQDVGIFLPQGEGALAWASLQNEMQMLLFSHPVNQAREAQDKPIINSLWCYGLGQFDG